MSPTCRRYVANMSPRCRQIFLRTESARCRRHVAAMSPTCRRDQKYASAKKLATQRRHVGDMRHVNGFLVRLIDRIFSGQFGAPPWRTPRPHVAKIADLVKMGAHRENVRFLL